MLFLLPIQLQMKMRATLSCPFLLLLSFFLRFRRAGHLHLGVRVPHESDLCRSSTPETLAPTTENRLRPGRCRAARTIGRESLTDSFAARKPTNRGTKGRKIFNANGKMFDCP